LPVWVVVVVLEAGSRLVKALGKDVLETGLVLRDVIEGFLGIFVNNLLVSGIV